MIPVRTTVPGWYNLVRYLRPHEPFALTTAELDAACGAGPSLVRETLAIRAARETGTLTFMGRRVVEIDDWPEWMP